LTIQTSSHSGSISNGPVTVIIPALDERVGIGQVISRIPREITKEIIVVDSSNDGTGEVFNIATGRPSTLNELVRNLREKTGKQKLASNHKNWRPGDIRHSYANIEKARKILHYAPKYDLEKGIAKLTEWFLRRDFGKRAHSDGN
jgi:dTDP-D-glucose 4,6-dehydratase